jgi:hypothetical protein
MIAQTFQDCRNGSFDTDVDGGELEDGVGRRMEQFGDDGDGGRVPNDLALKLGLATRGRTCSRSRRRLLWR